MSESYIIPFEVAVERGCTVMFKDAKARDLLVRARDLYPWINGWSVRILGKIDEVDHLPERGETGDAWILMDDDEYHGVNYIAGDLFIWDTDLEAWIDIGPIVGPRGYTFTPVWDPDKPYLLTWTNDSNGRLENPPPKWLFGRSWLYLENEQELPDAGGQVITTFPINDLHVSRDFVIDYTGRVCHMLGDPYDRGDGTWEFMVSGPIMDLIPDLTWHAKLLPPGSDATVTYTNGGRDITIGVPDGVPGNPDLWVETETEAEPTSTTVELKTTSVNLASLAHKQTTIPMPVATMTYGGVWDAEMFRKFQETNEDVEFLKLQSDSNHRTAVQASASDDFSQAALNALFALSFPSNPPEATDRLIDTRTNKQWIYNNAGTWREITTSNLSLTTLIAPGLVKHSDAEGSIGYNVPGVGQVNGWDAMKQAITDAANRQDTQVVDIPFAQSKSTLLELCRALGPGYFALGNGVPNYPDLPDTILRDGSGFGGGGGSFLEIKTAGVGELSVELVWGSRPIGQWWRKITNTTWASNVGWAQNLLVAEGGVTAGSNGGLTPDHRGRGLMVDTTGRKLFVKKQPTIINLQDQLQWPAFNHDQREYFIYNSSTFGTLWTNNWISPPDPNNTGLANGGPPPIPFGETVRIWNAGYSNYGSIEIGWPQRSLANSGNPNSYQTKSVYLAPGEFIDLMLTDAFLYSNIWYYRWSTNAKSVWTQFSWSAVSPFSIMGYHRYNLGIGLVDCNMVIQPSSTVSNAGATLANLPNDFLRPRTDRAYPTFAPDSDSRWISLSSMGQLTLGAGSFSSGQQIKAILMWSL